MNVLFSTREQLWYVLPSSSPLRLKLIPQDGYFHAPQSHKEVGIAPCPRFSWSSAPLAFNSDPSYTDGCVSKLYIYSGGLALLLTHAAPADSALYLILPFEEK